MATAVQHQSTIADTRYLKSNQKRYHRKLQDFPGGIVRSRDMLAMAGDDTLSHGT